VLPCPTAGDVCGLPIVVPVNVGALPYYDTNTTCGRRDWYDMTCMGYYDGGEDIIYELNVTEPIDVVITMDPLGTTWTGLALDDSCPLDMNTCMAVHTGSSGTTVKTTGCQHLEPGLYYVQVDTWPSPNCIPSFDLTVDLCPGACCVADVCVATNTPPECDGLGGDHYKDRECPGFDCPPDCDMVHVSILTDYYYSETSWELVERDVGVVASGFGSYTGLHDWNVCIDLTKCYDFFIYDSYGDGIYQPGYWEVYYPDWGTLLGANYDFTGSMDALYNIGAECPTGACCLGEGNCQEMFPNECDDMGGAYAGDDTTCSGRADCNSNGMIDFCDIHWGWSQDCNGVVNPNGIPDECDIADCASACVVGEDNLPPSYWEWCCDCQNDGIPDDCQLVVGGDYITQSHSFDVLQYYGVSCSPNAHNRMARCFPNFVGGDVVSVDVGLEATYDSPCVVTLGFFDDTDGCPPTLANMNPIDTRTFNLDPSQNLTVVTVPIVPPITIPAGIDLVIDFEWVGNTWLGANPAGQDGYTYIQSDDCGLTDYWRTDDIGFPDAMLVMGAQMQGDDNDVIPPGGDDMPDECNGCGDGYTVAPEECDEGTGNSNDPNSCRPDCTIPYCCDGIEDDNNPYGPSEECDTGAAKSNTEPDACRIDNCPVQGQVCCDPWCGDGVVDTGEECDDGVAENTMEPNHCRPDCTFPVCCDNVVDDNNPYGEDEMCDNPLKDDYTPNRCRPTNCAGAATNVCCDPWCGDSVVDDEWGEVCDFAEATHGALCDQQCQWEEGACCYETAGVCVDGVLPENCPGDTQHGEFPPRTQSSFHLGKWCYEIECEKPAVPTISEWGLLVISLLLLTGIVIKFGRRAKATS
jgi:hypothetical protein